MILYRLYTEDKNAGNIRAAVAAYFDGFTVFQANGFWRHVGERTLVIEILATSADADIVRSIADTIKQRNQQESVLIVSIPVTAEF